VVLNVLDYVPAYACFYDIPMHASMTHLWATIRGIVLSLRVLLLVPVRRKVWTFEEKNIMSEQTLIMLEKWHCKIKKT
jgi:hypothetical protein